jgi:hypothetical protein
MRPKATRQDNWAQLGIGAAALLLPPLALGAAFYSMLAEPDEVVTRPAAVQAVAPPPAAAADQAVALPAAAPAALPATVGADAAFQPSAGTLTEGAPQKPQRRPVQGSRVQIATVAAPAAAIRPPADVEGSATAAETPLAPAAAPKRPAHRRRQPQEDPFPVRTWLQELGILPRNGKDGG